MKKLRYDHLVGKTFIHGTQDCFSLVRDFYKDNFDIELTNYARPDDWWRKGMSLYRDAISPEGFEVLMTKNVKQLRPADGMLMCLISTEPNHAAIYLGEGKILHHVYGRLSSVDMLDIKWQGRVTNYLRHTKVTSMEPVAEPFDLLGDPRVKRVLDYHASRRAS
jgi:cell wall-associated NlpC family hydrolase